MSISVSYNGASILQGIQPESIECAQLADMGETATGAFTVEDDAAALTLIGYQPVTISESACSQPRLFTGWTFERGYQRDPENAILTGVARTHDVSIVDVNACFGFRQITRTGTGGGNRPAETWAERLTWILESEYLSDWISSDQSFVVTNTSAMDATDYRSSYPSAVLQDLSDRSGNAYDYFAFWDPAAQEVRLFFDNDVASIGDSVLRISNVKSDEDGLTTFGPDKLAKLQRESDQVYSDVCVNYADGTLKLYRSRPSTYATFVRRSTQIDRPYTRSAATATLQADAWLDKHSVETDRVTCTIRVPASRVGLVQAGQRLQFKAPHMPGYSDFVWMRVVMCTPKPANEAATHYDVALELVYRPAPATPSEPECSFTQWSLLVDSSVDIFGDWMDGAGSFQNGASLYPCTQQITSTHGTALIGTCNDGDVWGWDAGVSTHADTFTATWTFDLSDAGLPLVCTAYVEWYEWSEDHNLSVEATDDLGGSWTEIVSPAESWANFGINTVIPISSPYPDYRYWRLKVVYTSPDGAAYFPPLHLNGFMLWAGTEPDPDVEIDLGPTPGATTIHTTDPTVDDDADAGYTVGSNWINTTTGHEFVLVDSTTGSAVWVSTTAVSVFSFSTSDGVTTVDPTTELTFVGGTLADLGGGVAELTFADSNAVTNIDGGKEVVNTVAAAGATETLDLGDGNVHDVTLDEDCTLTFAGATAGVACSFTLLLRQDGTGGWTTTWPGSVVWAGGTAPTLDETASTVAVLTFFTLDGGTVWYGFPTGGGGGGTPATTVTDEMAWGITPAVGSDTEYARQDHTHGSPDEPTGTGELLITDTPAGSPLVFADLLQNEAGTELLYAG